MYEIVQERVTELEHSYLVFRDLPDGNLFEEEMIGHNVIPGILGMQTLRVGRGKIRRYPTDGCTSLSECLLGRKLSGVELRRILSSLFARIAESKNYLLREESFVLRSDCIFLRNDTGDVELVYCPEYECPLPIQLRGLSDWLLAYLDPQDAQAVYSGYAFHVMSHEEGSTIQKMLAAVVREPERPAITTTAYQLPEETAEYHVSNVAESGEYADVAGRKKRGGIKGIFSFFSGISVLLILLGALAWAMG